MALSRGQAVIQSGDNSGDSPQDAGWLESGKPVEKEITSGESHHYRISLEAGQYLRARLDRGGLNLIVVLFAQDGQKLIELSRNPYPLGSIPLFLVAQSSSSYTIEVRLPVGDRESGHYTLRIDELRTATDEDRRRVLAEWTFIEAQQRSEQGTARSHREAIAKHEESLALYRALDDSHGQARALNYIGLSYSDLGDNLKALEYYAQSLPLYQAASDEAGQATVLNNTGLAYGRLSKPEKSIEYFNKTIVLRRAAGDQRGEAVTLNNIGMAYGRLSEYRKALGYLEQALSIYRVIGHRRLEAGALHNIGQVYSRLGEWQKSLECSARALPVARAVGNQRLEANILIAMGAAYTSLGDNQKALDCYNQALPLHRETGNRLGEASALARIGRLERSSGEDQKALEFFRQALSIWGAAGNRQGEAIALSDIGRLHHSVGENQKALEYLNQALPIARDAGDRSEEARILTYIGEVHIAAGEYKQANEYLSRALDFYRAIDSPTNQAHVLHSIAVVHRAEGSLSRARSKSDEAIRIVEAQRTRVASPESRASYLDLVRNYYELNIDVLMQLHATQPGGGLDAAALEVSERAHARSLLEMLAEARIDIRQGGDASLIETERSLLELIDAKTERQSQLLSQKHTPEQAAAAAAEIHSLVSELKLVQARLRASSPRYAALTQPTPLKLKDIQTRLLDEDTVLLQYILGEERSYVWTVSNHSLTSHQLPGRAEIEAAALRFYETARSRNRDPIELKEAGASLSSLVLSPVVDRLKDRVVIVADGILHYIPFAALVLPETNSPGDVAGQRTGVESVPLVARHEIVNLPSASVLAQIRYESARKTRARKTIAVFADPVFSRDDSRLRSAGPIETPEPTLTRDLERAAEDLGMGEGIARLPFSRREAQAILEIVPAGQSMKALDFHASRVVATGDTLGNYRIIHFATHGLLNNRHPGLSGILLSMVDPRGQPQNGFLRLHDIYNMKLAAELVVLSACQTGLGRQVRGEGLVGLTQAFMYAGAERVVASLWKVDDAATAELMKRFYREMLVKGLRPAAALRKAQLDMSKHSRWRAPYYWAAFRLHGAWN